MTVCIVVIQVFANGLCKGMDMISFSIFHLLKICVQ